MYTASLNLHNNPLESILLLDFVDEDMKPQRGKVNFLRKYSKQVVDLGFEPMAVSGCAFFPF